MQAVLCAVGAGGAVLVLFGTKGRHPGWIALLLTAVADGGIGLIRGVTTTCVNGAG